MFWLLALFLLTWYSAPRSHDNDVALESWEVLFWVCVPCGLAYEGVQLVREHGSIALYLSGSGNKLDAMMYSILLLAGICRIASAWNSDWVQWFVGMLALALFVSTLFDLLACYYEL